MSTLELFAAPQTARTPSYRSVIRNQFRLIDASRRFALLLLVVMAGTAFMMNEKWFNVPIEMAPLPVLMMAGMIWPFFVWQGETRTRRAYHRWLPVNQVAHDFAKVIAGAIWLTAACVLTLGSLTAVAWFFLAIQLWTMIELVSVVLGALLVYGFFSLLPILTDKPIHWFIGIWPLAFLASTGLDVLGFWGNYAASVFFDEPLGINGAIFGGLNAVNYGVPRIATWLLALALWSIVLVCALYLASRWANHNAEA